MGIQYFFNPEYIKQLTDEIARELDSRQYVDHLKSMFNDMVKRIEKIEEWNPNPLKDNIDQVALVVGDLLKRIEKLEYSNRVQPESPAKIAKETVQIPDIYYTSTSADLFEIVAINFPGQYLGAVDGDTKEMDRCVKGEAAKFVLWGEHSGSNSWIHNLRKIVGNRKFWLRRLTWKNLTSPGEGSDRPVFIVVRLLYEDSCGS